MNAATLFYYTATGCLIIIALLTIYGVLQFVETLQEIEAFLQEMRQMSSEAHNAPRKVGAKVLGAAANVLQFFLGRG